MAKVLQKESSKAEMTEGRILNQIAPVADGFNWYLYKYIGFNM